MGQSPGRGLGLNAHAEVRSRRGVHLADEVVVPHDYLVHDPNHRVGGRIHPVRDEVENVPKDYLYRVRGFPSASQELPRAGRLPVEIALVVHLSFLPTSLHSCFGWGVRWPPGSSHSRSHRGFRFLEPKAVERQVTPRLRQPPCSESQFASDFLPERSVSTVDRPQFHPVQMRAADKEFI